jgi:hypothetical protein
MHNPVVDLGDLEHVLIISRELNMPIENFVECLVLLGVCCLERVFATERF